MADKERFEEHFLIRMIEEETAEQPFGRPMCTRFPPEPNGYLHLGSAYAIHTNVEIAKRWGGTFHLRFDDTNPLKEDAAYAAAIMEDMKWLGCDPGEHIYFGSDYSELIYEAAIRLIERGSAYVCDLSPEETSAFRGTLTEPGTDSPYRGRSAAENLELFANMRSGAYPAGARVLRAKLDMRSPNMNMRDPVLYRIIHASHYRTGSDWCIYPMYDFAHPIQDAIEGITYSLCSVEFKEHRPLYEWVLRELGVPEPPRQREFGRLNLTGVVTSKRHLRQLVEGGFVSGWDDPRLPTIRALRRRGYTPASIRSFLDMIGGIRTASTVDISLLDHCLRQDLKGSAVSRMAVLRPLKVVITNYPEGKTEWLTIENNSENASLGTRQIPFGKEVYIEREDFTETPPSGYRRLSPGVEVRLKGAYYIRCEEALKDPATGEVIELRCTYDPATKSGTGFTGRKVKGTIHWVPAAGAVSAEVRLYEPLLQDSELPEEDATDWGTWMNPHSETIIRHARLEPAAAGAEPGERFQFIRHGYFCADTRRGENSEPVFLRTVPLKDSWNKRRDV